MFRAQDEAPFVGVHHRVIAWLRAVEHAAQIADGGNTEGACQDRGMTGWAGFLDRQTGDAARVPVEQFGRAEPAGKEDGAGFDGEDGDLAGQCGQQAVRQILHIRETLAQIDVADAPHTVMQLGGDPLNRRFGGHAVADDIADAA